MIEPFYSIFNRNRQHISLKMLKKNSILCDIIYVTRKRCVFNTVVKNKHLFVPCDIYYFSFGRTKNHIPNKTIEKIPSNIFLYRTALFVPRVALFFCEIYTYDKKSNVCTLRNLICNEVWLNSRIGRACDWCAWGPRFKSGSGRINFYLEIIWKIE